MIQNDGTKWTREEGLSNLAAVRFVELGEPEVEQVGHVIEEEGLLGRLARHLVELKVSPLDFVAIHTVDLADMCIGPSLVHHPVLDTPHFVIVLGGNLGQASLDRQPAPRSVWIAETDPRSHQGWQAICARFGQW